MLPQIVKANVCNAESLADAMKRHADRFRRDIREKPILGPALGNGRQHLLGESVEVYFLGLIVFACGEQNSRLIHVLPLAVDQFGAAHARGCQ